MAGPITWRTIMGASPADAARPLEIARQSIGDAFGQFMNVIRDREGFIQKQADTAAEANVQGFLDRIQGARTPEEIAALQESGELDTLRAGLRPQDLAQVRGAEDARLTSLMQQTTARNAFDDQALARSRLPLINQAAMLAAQGDEAGLNKLLAEQDLGDEAKFVTQLQSTLDARANRERQQVLQRREDTNFRHQQSMRPFELAAKALSVQASQEQISAAQENRALSKKQREQLEAAGKLEAERQLLKDTGNVYADGIFDPSDTQAINEMMVANGIGDSPGERQAIIRRIGKVAEQGLEYVDKDGKLATKKVPIPKSLITQAILGSHDQLVNYRANGLGGSGSWFGWNEGWANSMEENLRTALRRGLDDKENPRNLTVEDFERYMNNRLGAYESPVPVGGKKSR